MRTVFRSLPLRPGKTGAQKNLLRTRGRVETPRIHERTTKDNMILKSCQKNKIAGVRATENRHIDIENYHALPAVYPLRSV